jgi:hypothetical protein
MEKGLTISNFEPNAVIRGFQLTVVGSMTPHAISPQLESHEAELFCLPRPSSFSNSVIKSCSATFLTAHNFLMGAQSI